MRVLQLLNLHSTSFPFPCSGSELYFLFQHGAPNHPKPIGSTNFFHFYSQKFIPKFISPSSSHYQMDRGGHGSVTTRLRSGSHEVFVGDALPLLLLHNGRIQGKSMAEITIFHSFFLICCTIAWFADWSSRSLVTVWDFGCILIRFISWFRVPASPTDFVDFVVLLATFRINLLAIPCRWCEGERVDSSAASNYNFSPSWFCSPGTRLSPWDGNEINYAVISLKNIEIDKMLVSKTT